MSRKNILIIIVVLFILGIGYLYYPKNSSNSPSSQPTDETIFFWGQGCPHCENVEKFFQENGNLDQKLNIKKLEVFNDKNNQKFFGEKIKECNLNSSGVPVLYEKGRCFQGDTPIIDELKKQM